MIGSASIAEILATYQKYGWTLRRVLLTEALRSHLGAAIETLFNDIPIDDAAIDAVWFSRAPKPGGVAWELRHLSDAPYALLESLDETSDDFDDQRHAVEARLRDSVSAKRPA